jgi:hypothetical protein
MGSARLLRIALCGNAAFGGACAAVLLFAPDAAVAWLGADGGPLLPVLGAGLLAFGAGLVVLATRPMPPIGWVRAAILADGLWVAGTVAFFLTPWSAALSHRGVWFVTLVAACVLLWGILQSAGLRAARVGAASAGS